MRLETRSWAIGQYREKCREREKLARASVIEGQSLAGVKKKVEALRKGYRLCNMFVAYLTRLIDNM